MSEQSSLLSRLHTLIDSSELRKLWADESAWQGLRVDYDPPLVERLTARIGDLEIALQRCYPCEDDERVGWYSGLACPLAVRVLAGTMDFRVSALNLGESSATVFGLPAGASCEAADTQAWYYMRALGEPCYVVALFGPAPPNLPEWGERRALTPAEFQDLHATFGDLLAWNDR